MIASSGSDSQPGFSPASRVPLWSAYQSHRVEEKRLSELAQEGVKIQDKSKLSSVKKAVDFLNGSQDSNDCGEHGCCIVYSESSKSHFLLYKRGAQQKSFELCNIELHWDEKNWEKCKCEKKKIENHFLDGTSTIRDAVKLLNFPHDSENPKIADVESFCVIFDREKMSHVVIWSKAKGAKEEAAANCEMLVEQPTSGKSWNFRQLFGWKETQPTKEEKEIQFKSDALFATINKPLKERYQIVRELGSGAQGTTRLVKTLNSNDDDKNFFVAKESNDRSKEAQASFLQEFERMKALRHPNCLKVFELIHAEKQDYIITEYARGGDLFHYMRTMKENSEPVSESKLAKMFKDAMLGVAYLHDQKYIHNDLKPENILVMNAYDKHVSPRLVVADYGCVTVQGDKNKVFFGDPRYLCPEAMSAMMKHLERKKISTTFMSAKVDIWAMGATIYEVLASGALPFIYQKCCLKDLAGVYAELFAQVTSETPVNFDIPDAAFSADSKNLLNIMLAKDRDERADAAKILQHGWWENGAEKDVCASILENVQFADTRSRVRQILRNAVAAKLRYEHVARCFEVFQHYDPDKSGTISRDEFKKAFHELRIPSEDADTYFTNADVDKSDTLEFNEFAAITLDWMNLDNKDLDEHLTGLLYNMGCETVDGELQVDLKEFIKMFHDGLEKSDDLGLDKAMREIDENGDGFITIEELRVFVQGPTALCTSDAQAASDIGGTNDSVTRIESKNQIIDPRQRASTLFQEYVAQARGSRMSLNGTFVFVESTGECTPKD